MKNWDMAMLQGKEFGAHMQAGRLTVLHTVTAGRPCTSWPCATAGEEYEGKLLHGPALSREAENLWNASCLSHPGAFSHKAVLESFWGKKKQEVTDTEIAT